MTLPDVIGLCFFAHQTVELPANHTFIVDRSTMLDGFTPLRPLPNNVALQLIAIFLVQSDSQSLIGKMMRIDDKSTYFKQFRSTTA